MSPEPNIRDQAVLFLEETDEGFEGQLEDGRKVVIVYKDNKTFLGVGRTYYRASQNLCDIATHTGRMTKEEIFEIFNLKWF